MVLIIGGYAQGKKAYAKANFENAEGHILDLNEWIKPYIEKEAEALADIMKIIQDDPEKIIISTEVGCGIVPLEKESRIYRKQLGRFQCKVAEMADEVIRVNCGIGQKIK